MYRYIKKRQPNTQKLLESVQCCMWTAFSDCCYYYVLKTGTFSCIVHPAITQVNKLRGDTRISNPLHQPHFRVPTFDMFLLIVFEIFRVLRPEISVSASFVGGPTFCPKCFLDLFAKIIYIRMLYIRTQKRIMLAADTRAIENVFQGHSLAKLTNSTSMSAFFTANHVNAKVVVLATIPNTAEILNQW